MPSCSGATALDGSRPPTPFRLALAEAPAATPHALSLFGDDAGTEMKITSARSKPSKADASTSSISTAASWLHRGGLRTPGATPLVIAASPTGSFSSVWRYALPDECCRNFRHWSPTWLASAAANTFTYCANGVSGMSPLLYHMSAVSTVTLMRPGRRHRRYIAHSEPSRRGRIYPVRFSQFLPQLISSIWPDYGPPLPDVDPALVVSAWKSGLTHRRGLKAATLSTYGKYDLTGFGGLSCAMLSAPSDASYMGYDNHAWYRDVSEPSILAHSRRLLILLTPVTFRSEYHVMFQSIDPAATPAPDPEKLQASLERAQGLSPSATSSTA